MFLLSKQEVFNRAWKRSVVDRIPLSVEGGPGGIQRCVYRPRTGGFSRGCHIGILLSEKTYHASYEGHAVDWLAENEGFDLQNLFAPDVSVVFLSEIQAAHDAAAIEVDTSHENSFDVVRRNLVEIAARYALEIPC